MNGVKYITQIRREDLREIRAMVNAVPGVGIILDRSNDNVQIGLSEDQFKRMVYSFCRQAWPDSCPATTAVPIDNIDLGAEL